MADVSSIFWRAPPVTRTIVAAMFVESVLIYGRLLSYGYVGFSTSLIFKFPPQLWRLITPFLLTHGGYQFFFDLYFAWRYGTGLERNSPRFSEPGSFFVYTCFVALFTLVTAGWLLSAWTLTHSLLLAWIYTFAQDDRGTKAHFVVIQIPIELLPWALLLLTLLLGGPQAALIEGTGILAAHLYDFMTRLYPTFQGGRNYIRTPAVIRRFFAGPHARVTRKTYGTSFQRGEPAAHPGGSGWSSGISDIWGGRGVGRRLGGD